MTASSLSQAAHVQAHITILEGTEDSRRALLQGLEYLVQISFVDDDEVRCACCSLCIESAGARSSFRCCCPVGPGLFCAHVRSHTRCNISCHADLSAAADVVVNHAVRSVKPPLSAIQSKALVHRSSSSALGTNRRASTMVVPDPAVQVLKITLDYWNFFVPDVFSSAAVIDANAAFAFAEPVPVANRRLLYAGILSKLRQLCITRMAKPEEVRPCAQRCEHPNKHSVQVAHARCRCCRAQVCRASSGGDGGGAPYA